MGICLEIKHTPSRNSSPCNFHRTQEMVAMENILKYICFKEITNLELQAHGSKTNEISAITHYAKENKDWTHGSPILCGT